jgi:pimeloyl-ACP methyl ester carboxylesterase
VEQQSTEIAGQRIAYLESPGGRGRPAVIFVHGNSSSARTWLPVLDGGFGGQFRCLALDLPGHGQSDPARDQASYSLPGYAAALAGFAKALGAADAVTTCAASPSRRCGAARYSSSPVPATRRTRRRRSGSPRC